VIFDNKSQIEPVTAISKIIDFIHFILKERESESLVIPYKHCIESIINIHLACLVVGRENVKVLVTKDKIINPYPQEEKDQNTLNQYVDLPAKNKGDFS
jgi:hypothetical protein